MATKLFIILGNQLFDPIILKEVGCNRVFMAEDFGLCTYEKHHKLKILLFLSSMRSYADNLKKNNFKITYSKIDNSHFKVDYITKNGLHELQLAKAELLEQQKILQQQINYFIENGVNISGIE